MAIQDRDYYRDDSHGSLLRVEISGTLILIVTHIVLFFAVASDLTDRTGIIRHAGFDTLAIKEGQLWRLVTAPLIPMRDLITLALGLVMLYVCGYGVETIYGRKWFLTFYMLAGLVGSIVKLILGLSFQMNQIPVGIAPPLFAVTVLYALHYPRSVTFLNLPVPIFVGVLLSIYLLSGIIRAISGGPLGDASSVAGAAIFSFLFFRYFDSLQAALSRQPQRRTRTHTLRMYRPPEPVEDSASLQKDTETVATVAKSVIDEQLEAKVDELLEKVAKSGRGSLTPSEQDYLLKASQAYRNKQS